MTKKAFTLTEIMITLIIMGIIMAWGIPNYNRGLNRARAQSVMRSMRMIYDANLLYLARHNVDFTQDFPNTILYLDQINNMNGDHSLNIISPARGVFQCVYWPMIPINECMSSLTGGGFNINLNLDCPVSETPIANCWTDGSHPNPRCDHLTAQKVCP